MGFIGVMGFYNVSSVCRVSGGFIRLRVSKGLGFITITLGLGADC